MKIISKIAILALVAFVASLIGAESSDGDDPSLYDDCTAAWGYSAAYDSCGSQSSSSPDGLAVISTTSDGKCSVATHCPMGNASEGADFEEVEFIGSPGEVSLLVSCGTGDGAKLCIGSGA